MPNHKKSIEIHAKSLKNNQNPSQIIKPAAVHGQSPSNRHKINKNQSESMPNHQKSNRHQIQARTEQSKKRIPVRPQFGDVLAIAASADLPCSQHGESSRSVVELSNFAKYAKNWKNWKLQILRIWWVPSKIEMNWVRFTIPAEATSNTSRRHRPSGLSNISRLLFIFTGFHER